MSTDIEVVIVNADGITVTHALAETMPEENLLEWTDPFTGDTCLFRLHRDVKQIWIESGP